MKAVLLLADWAEVVGGKLYIQGGGWSRVQLPPSNAVSFAVAMKIDVGWDETNRQHRVRLALADQDGEPVEFRPGQPFLVESQLEVGRPPGLALGTPIDVPLTLTFRDIPIVPGRYELTLSIDGDVLTQVAFDVFSP